MRIVIVNHEFPPIGGGGATASSHIAAELARDGHEVLVITSSVPGLPRRDTQHGYSLYRLPTFRHARFAPKPYELLSYCASCWYGLRRAVKVFRAEGIIAFFAVPSGYFAVQAARSLKIPVVVSLRGSDVPGFSRKRLGGVYRSVALPIIRSTLLRADSVAPNCPSLARLAMQFVPEISNKLRIVPNGIEPTIVADEPAHSDGKSLRLIQVGQLISRKRVQLTIEAMRLLADRGVSAELTIVGTGPLEKELKQQIEQAGLIDHITLTGYMPRTGTLELMRQADLFVMTSKAEGMSNAVMEAMACGLPVIVTANGADDMVREACSGVIVEEADPHRLADLIEQLSLHIDQRRSMGKAGIGYAKQHSWRATGLNFLHCLEETQRGGRIHSSEIFSHDA